MLQLQPIIGSYQDRGLVFILVTSEDRNTTQTVIDEYDLDVLVIHDPGADIAALMEVRGLPTGIFFDREGNLFSKTIGWGNQSLNEWKSKAEELLSD